MEITKNLKGDELKIFFNFLNNKADEISIERYCSEKIPEDEFIKVQNEYKEYIKKEDVSRRKQYEKDENYRKKLNKLLGIKKQDEANSYFNDLLKQDLDVLNMLNNDGDKKQVKKIEKEVLKRKYTRITPTTQGPLMELYYLKKGELLKEIEKNLKELFDFPYIINNVEYENLTFYKDNKCIFAVCSHEEFAFLENINEEELKNNGIKL